VAAPKSLALPAAASALLLPVLLLLLLPLPLLPLLQQRHLLQWKGMQWLLLLLLRCARVVQSSAHAPLDMLGSLLCTPPFSECFRYVLWIIPPDFGKILL
jgi:hypothetical protein